MKHNLNPKVIATGLFNVADQNDDLDNVRDALRTLNHIVIDSGQFRALVQSKKIKDDAKDQIQIEKDKAIAEIRHEVVTLTISVAEKVIGKNLSVEDNQQLIEKSILDLKKHEA